MSTLSVYAKELPEGATEARYLEKIRVKSVDPFILFSGGNGTDITRRASLPPVDSSDIVSYLVLQTSFITTKQFKAYKSLEAYNQFINGWVKEVNAWNVKDKIVVTGRVSIL